MLDAGRGAFARRAWDEAFADLSAADQLEPLAPEDLERLAIASGLLERDGTDDVWTRAHRGYVDAENKERSVRAAFWLGMYLVNKGEMARAGGWFARAQRALDEADLDCPERGLLMIPIGLQTMYGGDPVAAAAIFEEAGKIGERSDDPDLRTLSLLGRGQALIAAGDISTGVVLHDEVMVAVTAAEVSPIVVGIAYCAVIEACQAIFDIERAQEWTAALTRWCASQPSLVPFRGQCLVYRAQIMQMHGAWPDALAEAERACERLSTPPQPAVGMAFYQLGELHRLRGEFARAEADYANANGWGHSPQPGLALLRLQQGQHDAAQAATRRLMDEESDRATRSRLLPAHVEIMIAVGDLDAARAAVNELDALADDIGLPFLRAVASHTRGHVMLAAGDARGGLTALRDALRIWHKIEAVYEAARTRVLIATACETLGDHETAAMEKGDAIRAFRSLGAQPDLARLEVVPMAAAPGGLTAREVEVLRLVAAGKTNRAIANALVISEKTVARHVSNIFTKLDLGSRSAATAYAYEHDLV